MKYNWGRLLQLFSKELLNLDKIILNEKKTMKRRPTTPQILFFFSDSVISEKVINDIVNEYILCVYIFSVKILFLLKLMWEEFGCASSAVQRGRKKGKVAHCE